MKHAQPQPVDALHTVVFQEAPPPELLEYNVLRPFHETPVRGRRNTNARRIQRIPRASGVQHEQDCIQRVHIRNARIVASKQLWLLGRQQWFHPLL